MHKVNIRTVFLSQITRHSQCVFRRFGTIQSNDYPLKHFHLL